MSMGLDPIRTVRGVGIDQYRAGLGEYLGEVMSDAWNAGPLSQAGRLVQASYSDEFARERGDRLLTAQEASDQGRDLGLRFDQPVAQGAYDVLASEKQRQNAAETVFKRARIERGYGTLPWLLGGGAEFLAMAADPLNIASAFVPVVGEARYATWAARSAFGATLARGAIEGGAGQLLLEPLAALDRRSLGDEYSMLDTLLNVGFGGGLGVALHGAAYGAGAGFRFIRDRWSPPPSAERTAPSAPRGEPSAIRPSIEVVKDETPPPRQPVAERMEQLRPETKDAAMRVAVSQLAQDKPVDVTPVLAADPNWPAIKAAIEQDHRAVIPELQAQSVAGRALPQLVPADYQPSPEELKLATRVSRGWEPEVPLKRPQSLVDFVRRGGGLRQGTPEAAELTAADVHRQPGMLRTKENGRQADHMAQAALDAGYRFGKETATGSGVDVDAFVKALIEDASGRRKHFPDDAYTEAWHVQQDYFAAFRQDLEDRGIQTKGMEPRRLAWLLAQDRDTQKLMSLLDRIDQLGPDASAELAYRLDAEAAAAEAEIAAREVEPGARETDMVADERDIPAVTLEELERYYADHEGAADQSGEGQGAPGRRAAGRGADEGGQAGADRPGQDRAAAEGAGLRRAGDDGAQGSQGAGEGLAEFAERQQAADLHADPDALSARDQRLQAEARDTAQLLADDLRDYGHALDDEGTRAIFDETGRFFDEEAKAIDALASCQLDGGR